MGGGAFGVEADARNVCNLVRGWSEAKTGAASAGGDDREREMDCPAAPDGNMDAFEPSATLASKESSQVKCKNNNTTILGPVYGELDLRVFPNPAFHGLDPK